MLKNFVIPPVTYVIICQKHVLRSLYTTHKAAKIFLKKIIVKTVVHIKNCRKFDAFVKKKLLRELKMTAFFCSFVLSVRWPSYLVPTLHKSWLIAII